MNRRDLLKLMALVTGGAVVGAEVLLTGCNNPDRIHGPGAFTEDDLVFLDEIAETILPRTKSPGAKDAGAGRHIAIMVNDCYKTTDQKAFHEGIAKLDEECRAMHGKGFMKADANERHAVLVKLDGDAKKYMNIKNEFDNQQVEKEREEIIKGNTSFKREERTAHYFSMMKQLTIAAYFTSKEGRTAALNYTPVPGRYDGNVSYKKGDRMNAGLA